MTQTPAAAAVTTIDNEHQVQAALLDSLSESLASDADPTAIEEIMSQVSDYSSVHFMSEQLLMRLHAYPGYEGHIQDHDRLLDSLAAASKVLAERPLDRERATTSIGGIRKELLEHIDGHDDELHSWLVTEGIGASPSVRVSPIG